MRSLRPHHSLPHLRHLRSSSSAADAAATAAATAADAAATMQSNQASSSTAESQQALTYHNRTKHSLTAGYARGPRNLDWANQPNPFLRFPSAPLLPLPHPPLSPSPPYLSLFSAATPAPSPISVSSVSGLLFDSLSLSAWKSTGLSTWSLRVNPSSGNLHPTEAHILSPAIPSLNPNPNPFIAHYSPKDHSLQLRALLPHPLPFPSSCLLLTLSSIFWREAWKYGERALRYCNHDVGHAIAAVTISAAALGWDARLLDGLGHADIAALLGIDHDNTQLPPPDRSRGRFPIVEAQHPDCVLLFFPTGDPPTIDYPALTAAISSVQWLEGGGVTNSLSKDHVYWDVIYRTADAVRKPHTDIQFTVNPLHPSKLLSEGLYKDLTVRELVRKRRSAVDMDGVHIMKRDTFYQILLHCLPSGEVGPGERQGEQLAVPFRVLTWDAEVHAALFVHRVADLPKGLYFLVRNEGHFDSLKRAMRAEFKWEKPEGCPEGLPLYRLERGDCQEVAKQLSCHQDIAADGCFSLGMVARFAPVIEKNAWMYPRLFWETGVLGQVLYLEAHAVGISATGIGCYFDDGVHQVLGLKDSEFQSLYHFTVGSPVLDKRIMSLPAYPGPGIDA